MASKPGFRIKTIHAYTAIGDDNEEGIIGELIDGTFMPFVCADEDRLRSLRQNAVDIGKMTGKKIKLVRFSVREDIEDVA